VTPAIIAVVVLAIVLKLRRRNRNRSTHQPSQLRQLFEAQLGTVGLVAAREVRERTRGRVFRVGTLLILVAVAAAIVIPLLNSHKTSVERVGAVGAFPASLRAEVIAEGPGLHVHVLVITETTTALADEDLRSGKVDLLIIDGSRLVTRNAVAPGNTSTTAALNAIADAISLENAYRRLSTLVRQMVSGITPSSARPPSAR
jgi:hypothetical protein